MFLFKVRMQYCRAPFGPSLRRSITSSTVTSSRISISHL
uniref:Uncharacterized protein n=1 Tax=Parascaris univalens TaxID=6257 RepID=A0A915BS87_PARUN